MKIAIQGGQASFHHIAANKFFKEQVETKRWKENN